MKIPRRRSSSSSIVMERRNSQLGERLRLKDRILESINKAIKQIQEQQFCSGEELLTLSNEDRLLKKLCEHLDHAFLHGLRHITNGYWQVAKEFTRKEAIKEINRLTKVTTNLGRGRAWLYMALCENLLECYIKCFSENASVVGKYYVKDALLLDDQRLHILLTMTSGLEFVTFDLDYDVPYLDLASYMPNRRPSQAPQMSEDDDERLSLCSMSSDISQASSQANNFDLESFGSFNNNTRPLDLNFLHPSDTSSLDSTRTSSDMPGISQSRSRSPSLNFENDTHSRLLSLEIDDVNDLEVIRVKKSKSGKKRSGSKSKEDKDSVPSTPVTPELSRPEFPIPERNGDVSRLDDIAETLSDNASLSEQKVDSDIKNDVKIESGSEYATVTIDGAASQVKLRQKKASITFEEKRNSFSQILQVAFVPNDDDPDGMKSGDISALDSSQADAKINAPFGQIEKRNSQTSNGAEHAGICDNKTDQSESPESACADAVPGVSNSTPVKDETEKTRSEDSKCYSSFLEKFDSGSFDIYKTNASGQCDDILPEVLIEEIPDPLPGPDMQTSRPISPYVDLYCQDGKIHTQILSKKDIGFVSPKKRTECLGKERSPQKVRSKKHLDLNVALDSKMVRGEGDGASQGSPDDSTNGRQDGQATPIVSPEQHLHEAEMKVDNNSMLYLMLEVFQDQDEQFIKMYHTCLGHMEGDVQPIFVLLTDRALYLLGRYMGGPRYRKEAVVKYTELDYISLSMNCHIINIVCTNRRKQFWITTGDEDLTKNIVGQLDQAVRQSDLDLPRLSVLTDATVQKIGLRKWISQDCRSQPSEVELHHYCLVHWEDAAHTSRPTHGVSKEGMLLHKAQGIFGGLTWKTAYFVLKDGVLYQYDDKHDNSLPKLCVQLNSEDCGGCRRCTTTDRDHCIEIILSNGSSLQMSAASSTDAQSWIQCLCQAVSEGVSSSTSFHSTCLACCLVLTQTKVLMCHEDVQTNFFRTLGSGALEDITAVTTDPGARTYCVLEFESQDARVTSERWILYFNSEVETTKFTTVLSHAWSQIFQVSIPIQRITDVVLQKRCREGVAKLKAAMRQYNNSMYRR